VMSESSRDAAMASLTSNKGGHPRQAFNNIYFHLSSLPSFPLLPTDDDVVSDGNLFWSPQTDTKLGNAFFDKFRTSEHFTRSQSRYEPGSSTHSLVADPKLASITADPSKPIDFRLGSDSPAIDAGVELPSDLPDPMRKADSGKPDIGAIPFGETLPQVARKPE
jgi:hypothetical protein